MRRIYNNKQSVVIDIDIQRNTFHLLEKCVNICKYHYV